MSTADNVLAALQAYKLKDVGSGKYRSNSPFRTSSDSESFTLTVSEDGEHGAYHDFVSDESGSLYSLAERLGIPLPERTPVADSKRAYTGLDDYALAHGIPPEILQAAGYREVTKEGRLALEFPTRTGKRWRFLDGERPTYKSQSGYKRCWYGQNKTLYERLAAGQPLVICNGEISVITAHYYGLAAIAVTGGEHEIPPDLLDTLKTEIGEVGKVYIVLDCDDKGQRIARQMEAQLCQAGFNALALDLKLGKGGDLADFCHLHGANSLAALDKLSLLSTITATVASVVERTRRRLLSAADLSTLPLPTFLIPGQLMERGLTGIYGPPGSGKSFLALDCALQVAQTQPVVYIAAEGLFGIRPRIDAWLKHHKGTHDRNLYFMDSAVAIFDSGDTETFLKEIAAIAPRLVVVDTLARCMIGGDENATRDMTVFMAHCDQIQRTIDGAVLIVHHARKDGLTERGSTVFRAGCDVVIRLTVDDDVICVETEKVKDAAQPAPRYMKLLPVQLDNGRDSCVLIPESQIAAPVKGDPLKSQHQVKVLEALAMPAFVNGATYPELVNATNIPDRSIYRVVSSLVNREYVIECDKIGSLTRHKITNEGRAALQQTQDRSQDRSEFAPPDPRSEDRSFMSKGNSQVIASPFALPDPTDLTDPHDQQPYLIRPPVSYP